MKVTKIPDPLQALKEGKYLPYAMIRCNSLMHLGHTPQKDIDAGQLLEARFFDKTKEIRVFRVGDQLHAVTLEEEPDDILIQEEYGLVGTQLGQCITLCRHIDFDEDGQAYRSTTRLTGWKGEKSHG